MVEVPQPNLCLKQEIESTDKYKKYLEFEEQHLTLKELIKKITYYDKEARNNYFYLCLLCWIKSNQIQLIVPLKNYDKLYKPESISRVYRELVTEAKAGNKELQYLLKDEETLNKRENLENFNHSYYQNINNSKVALEVK